MTNTQTNPPPVNTKGAAAGGAGAANRDTVAGGAGADEAAIFAAIESLSLVMAEADRPTLHKVSEEQPQKTEFLDRRNISEKFWGFAGIAAGSFIPAITILDHAFFAPDATPINPLGLFIVLTFFIPFGIAVFVRRLCTKNSK
jgi:hypothetical protein